MDPTTIWSAFHRAGAGRGQVSSDRDAHATRWQRDDRQPAAALDELDLAAAERASELDRESPATLLAGVRSLTSLWPPAPPR